MPQDLGKTLRQALLQLKQERDRIDRQMSALEAVLAPAGRRRGRKPGRRRRGRKPGRRQMTVKEKRAVSRRMKAYWAERRKARRK